MQRSWTSLFFGFDSWWINASGASWMATDHLSWKWSENCVCEALVRNLYLSLKAFLRSEVFVEIQFQGQVRHGQAKAGCTYLLLQSATLSFGSRVLHGLHVKLGFMRSVIQPEPVSMTLWHQRHPFPWMSQIPSRAMVQETSCWCCDLNVRSVHLQSFTWTKPPFPLVEKGWNIPCCCWFTQHEPLRPGEEEEECVTAQAQPLHVMLRSSSASSFSLSVDWRSCSLFFSAGIISAFVLDLQCCSLFLNFFVCVRLRWGGFTSNSFQPKSC